FWFQNSGTLVGELALHPDGIDIVMERASQIERQSALDQEELWIQLGTPYAPDEIRLGSPSSPLITILRLSILLADHTRKSVLVVFRIVDNGDGTFRPWKSGDPHVPRLSLPPMDLNEQDNIDRPRSPPYTGTPAVSSIRHTRSFVALTLASESTGSQPLPRPVLRSSTTSSARFPRNSGKSFDVPFER
ncbi:hypothetical protein JCM5353_005741, partial [Sporobolomyces roseus]